MLANLAVAVLQVLAWTLDSPTHQHLIRQLAAFHSSDLLCKYVNIQVRSHNSRSFEPLYLGECWELISSASFFLFFFGAKFGNIEAICLNVQNIRYNFRN